MSEQDLRSRDLRPSRPAMRTQDAGGSVPLSRPPVCPRSQPFAEAARDAPRGSSSGRAPGTRPRVAYTPKPSSQGFRLLGAAEARKHLNGSQSELCTRTCRAPQRRRKRHVCGKTKPWSRFDSRVSKSYRSNDRITSSWRMTWSCSSSSWSSSSRLSIRPTSSLQWPCLWSSNAPVILERGDDRTALLNRNLIHKRSGELFIDFFEACRRGRSRPAP
jgi:hypothetical protein